MDIRRILATELRLLEPICEFQKFDGYTVYRSERFPTYYGGNGIDIEAAGSHTLIEWEQIFREHFPRDRFVHETFSFARDEGFSPLIDEAERNGYNVEEQSYLFASDASRAPAIPEFWRVRRVTTERDWTRLGAFYRSEAEGYDWFDPESTDNSLFEKTRYTSEAIGIEWFTLTPPDAEDILCSLGIFEHNGICRLQDVWTSRHHRRAGLATALVGHALRYALQHLHAEGLAVCADIDYYAIDLYRKLGFEVQGEAVTLMRYPVHTADEPSELQ